MRSAIVALLLLCPSGGAALQVPEPTSVPQGARVRVAVPGERGVYRLVEVDGGALVLRQDHATEDAPQLTIPLASVRRLELDAGRRGRGAGLVRGLGYGALIGGLGGAAIGFISGDDECPPEAWCLFEFTAAEKALMAGVVLGGAGAITGAVIGTIFPGRRWERVELPLDLAIAPRGGRSFAVAATVRF